MQPSDLSRNNSSDLCISSKNAPAMLSSFEPSYQNQKRKLLKEKKNLASLVNEHSTLFYNAKQDVPKMQDMIRRLASSRTILQKLQNKLNSKNRKISLLNAKLVSK